MTASEAVIKLENLANYLDKYPQDSLGQTSLKNLADEMFRIRDALIDAGAMQLGKR